MVGKILTGILKLFTYLVCVAFAVYFTPKVLSNVLHTQYPIATITSGSMWPVLKVNDLVLMRGITGSEAEVGQVVIFKNQKGFTIHRLIRKAPGVLVTKGDANNVEDAPIKESDVIGRAVYVGKSPFRIPYLGFVARNFGPKILEIEQQLEKKI